MNADATPDLAVELRDIKRAIREHNRTIRGNRVRLWAVVALVAGLTTLGLIGYADDQADDRRECRLDNENSVRDSEALIETVRRLEGPSEEITVLIEDYRREVRNSRRVC